jgi:hypothetical protein
VTAPPDYVAVVTVPGGADARTYLDMTATPADAAYVVGPHYYLGLDAVATTQRFAPRDSRAFFDLVRPRQGAASSPIPSGWTDRPALQAAPGHELVVAHLVEQPGKTLNGDTGVGAASITGTSAVDASVRVGREPPVSLGGSLENGSLVMVSVPTGGDPLIVIDDSSGHPQSLHLRTGQRADAIGVLYPVRSQDIAPSVATTLLVTMDGRQYIPTVALKESVSLTAWDYRRGWARPGRAWLLVDISFDSGGSFFGTLKLDTARTFTLTGAGAGTLHAVADTVGLDVLSSTAQAATVVFDVPDSFRRGTLGCALAGTVEVESGKPQPIRVYASQHTTAQLTLAG